MNLLDPFARSDDPRTGHPINNNYPDYLVAVNADVPEIECIFLDFPDTIMNEYGAREIGEIRLTGLRFGTGFGDLPHRRSASPRPANQY